MAPPLDRRLLSRVPAVRVSLAISVALGLVSTGAIVVQALALGSLLASAMVASYGGNRLHAFVWLAVAASVRALCAFGGEVVARVGASLVKADIRGRLLNAALSRTGSSGAPSHADLATVAGLGLDALDVYIGRCLPDLVLAATAPLALVAAVGALDWISCLVLLVVLALFPVFAVLVGRSSTALARQRWRQVETLGRQVVDVFEGLPVLKAFGRSQRQRARIAEAGEALRDASLKTLRLAFMSAFVLDELASVSVALVAVPLGLRLLTGSIHLYAALAVLVIAPEVFVPIRRASAEFHQSTEGLAACNAAVDLLGDDARPPSPPVATPTPDPAGQPVTLDSVGFSYPGRSHGVLQAMSLVVAPGETVVVVGPNGSGKSTILSLLLGFLLPSEGHIRVGETDLAGADLAAWRRLITYLPEHPTLFADSLAANLRLAAPSASDGELLAAIGLVFGAGFLKTFPAGLDTPLGEAGRPVSAGERQRIALGRVLLRPASLYLLDEPTAHLDPESEAALVEVLGRHLEGKSAVVVTHRPALLAIADRVVTISEGRADDLHLVGRGSGVNR